MASPSASSEAGFDASTQAPPAIPHAPTDATLAAPGTIKVTSQHTSTTIHPPSPTHTSTTAPQSPANPSSPPPLPTEAPPPPLPSEPIPISLSPQSSTAPTTTAAAAAPGTAQDDGWDPVWDPTTAAFYFHNRFTQATQWENPRVAHPGSGPAAPGPADRAAKQEELHPAVLGGYNPAIHGSYDPTAPYAQATIPSASSLSHPDAGIDEPPSSGAGDAYAQSAGFNRYTGRFQASTLTPGNFDDDAKSQRQMNAFFDVDAARDAHGGRSLKAERAAKKLSRQEVKAYKERRKERKEEKRRAWLRD